MMCGDADRGRNGNRALSWQLGVGPGATKSRWDPLAYNEGLCRHAGGRDVVSLAPFPWHEHAFRQVMH